MATNSQNTSVKVDETRVNTGVKHTIAGKNYTIYVDKTLKNPLSGFFVKVDDKKKKVKLTDLTAEKADKLKAVLKNAAKPPPGKKVNPLTGRFITIGGAANLKLNPKTFKDPISLATVKKTDGIELNKTWYSKTGLRQWINSGKDTIPHTRRAFTETEINAIYTGKNGQKIPRKTNSNNNNNNRYNRNNSNNNNIYENNNDRHFTTEYNYADMYEVQEGGQKTFATFADFKEYINNLYYEMRDNDVGGVNDLEIKITDRPGSVIKMSVNRTALMDRGGNMLNDWIDIYFDITRGGEEIPRFATDIDMRSVIPDDLLRRVNRVLTSA